MQIQDFTDLKPVSDDIEIPLNGVVYYADPNPAADLVLAAVGTGGLSDDDIALLVEAANNGQEAMTPTQQGRAAVAGMSATTRALRFLQDVLRPESAATWAENMKAKGTPEAITLAQCMAVYRALLEVYTGRPTTPPPSSRNGRGGTGRSSTAGARAKE